MNVSSLRWVFGKLRAEGECFKDDTDERGSSYYRILQSGITHQPRIYCRRRSSSYLLFYICMINDIPYYYNTLFCFRQFYFCKKTQFFPCFSQRFLRMRGNHGKKRAPVRGKHDALKVAKGEIGRGSAKHVRVGRHKILTGKTVVRRAAVRAEDQKLGVK